MCGAGKGDEREVRLLIGFFWVLGVFAGFPRHVSGAVAIGEAIEPAQRFLRIACRR